MSALPQKSQEKPGALLYRGTATVCESVLRRKGGAGSCLYVVQPEIPIAPVHVGAWGLSERALVLLL